MNTKTFTSLLLQPELLDKEHFPSIENIIQEFPYFQAAKALYLKGLRNEESFRYNTALKVTAAYTSDRHVLFDFITSKTFKSKAQPTTAIVEDKKNINDITVEASETLTPLPSVAMEDVLKMKLPEANQVLSPALFSKKEPTAAVKEALETLQPDKPLAFDKNELYSFSEWLKITSLHPIQRVSEESMVDPPVQDNQPQKEHEERIHKEVEQEHSEKIRLQKKKFKIIDQFISNNPKIGPVSKQVSPRNLAKEHLTNQDTLMTETLAKVYIAQKNYKKAIQAYNILILKNPEKSGFFADQIRAIQHLKDNQ